MGFFIEDNFGTKGSKVVLSKLAVEVSLYGHSSTEINHVYLFTKRPPTDVEGSQNSTGRDALNEKPLKNRPNVFTPAIQRNLGKSAILRTSYGDIYIDLFGKECPKTVENFTTHAMNKYYDGCIFH